MARHSLLCRNSSARGVDLDHPTAETLITLCAALAADGGGMMRCGGDAFPEQADRRYKQRRLRTWEFRASRCDVHELLLLRRSTKLYTEMYAQVGNPFPGFRLLSAEKLCRSIV